jgi:hypothetical protein
MKTFERIVLYCLLTVCAISLAINAYYNLSADAASRAGVEYRESIRSQTLQNIADLQTTVDNYEKAAYDNSAVDRIAEQQLLATETTNVLLVKVTNQIALLTLVILK